MPVKKEREFCPRSSLIARGRASEASRPQRCLKLAPPVNGDAAAKITTTKSAVGFVPQTTPALHDGTPFLYRIDSKPRWALICLAPKAGSSMWKRALVKGLLDQGLPMLDAPGKWHGQPLPYNTSAQEVALSKVTRIMIVRHPVPRLLSAYLGKGLTNRIHVSGWDRAQGFRGFVDAIIHTNRSDLDLHYAHNLINAESVSCMPGMSTSSSAIATYAWKKWATGIVKLCVHWVYRKRSRRPPHTGATFM